MTPAAHSSDASAAPRVLDGFQVEAVAAVDAGSSVLVAAPTGSGKTLIAEHATAVALERGERAFYTTPIKALSNQKYRDLVALHGADAVGLLTGDNAINGDARIVVMTTEVLRNMLYANGDGLRGLGWVVLDEVHYLQDPYRGSVWEEVVVHTPLSVRFVYLSATVSNVDELAGWLRSVRGDTALVVEHRRPVELRHQVLAAERGRRSLVARDAVVRGRPNRSGARWGGPQRNDSSRRGSPNSQLATPRRVAVVTWLAKEELLPSIYFIFSRVGCDDALARLASTDLVLTEPDEEEQIAQIFARHTARLTPKDRRTLGLDEFQAVLQRGMAAHHAGMVPPVKEAVEDCFAAGLVKIVFATETLALGVNMPARSVVIESLSKFGGERHELLTPGQYTQLSGRAGRRGLDPIGHCVVLWSPYVDFEDIGRLAASHDYPLESAFSATCNMAVNLVRRHTPAGARELLEKSFAQYQADRRADASVQDSWLSRRFELVLRLLEAWGYLDGWALSAKGTLLAGIFHESDLLVAESLSEGIFDGLAAPELAGLASCLTYEHRSRLPAPPPWYPSPEVASRFEKLEALAGGIIEDQFALGLPPTRWPDPTFLATAHGWVGGADLASTLDAAEMSGGDFVRNARLLADLLRQLGSQATDADTRREARRAAAAILQGVVASTLAEDIGLEETADAK